MVSAKELTKRERMLFEMTGSKALNPSSQRMAIARSGLSSMSLREIRAAQRKAWQEYVDSDSVRPDHRSAPLFVLAARFASQCSWTHARPGVKPGIATSCPGLREIAFARAKWFRLQKRNHGVSSVYGAGIRTETNGKSGWNKVSDHYADYGCVVSHDGKQVAWSFQPGEWGVSRLWRGRFFVRNEKGERRVMEIGSRYPQVQPELKLRHVAACLRRAGFKAAVTWQTHDEVAFGCGTVRNVKPEGTHRFGIHDGRKVSQWVVVDLGAYGIFHFSSASFMPIRVITNALLQRKKIARREKWENAIGGLRVFVSREDSTGSGNCGPGTDAFSEKAATALASRYGMQRSQIGQIGALRSDFIISLRGIEDPYARRAIIAAAERVDAGSAIS